jgi:hypothetical protein
MIEVDGMFMKFDKMHGPWHLRNAMKTNLRFYFQELAAFQAAHRKTALSGSSISSLRLCRRYLTP